MDYLYYILNYFYESPYEFWGFLTSVICVWLSAKENIWGWTFAIIASAFSFKVFWDVNLPGDAFLQIFFIGASIYGIYEWKYGGKEHSTRQVSKMPFSIYLILLGVFVLSWLGVRYALSLLQGDIVEIDAATTALSLIGQWMMAKKYLETWILWIAVDSLYVGVYIYKEVYLYALLYFIFLFLATQGYIYWRRSYQQLLAHSEMKINA